MKFFVKTHTLLVKSLLRGIIYSQVSLGINSKMTHVSGIKTESE
jgi:hypothetical protein